MRVRAFDSCRGGGVYWPAIARSRQEHSAACWVLTPRTLELMRLSACCVRGARVSWGRARRPSVGVCSGVCIVSALLWSGCWHLLAWLGICWHLLAFVGILVTLGAPSIGSFTPEAVVTP